MFEEEIRKILRKHVKGEIVLEIPPDSKMGDYAFPCFLLAKEFKKSPKDIASELLEKVKLTKAIKKVEVNGPYLNFFVNKEELAAKVLPLITKGGYGKDNVKEKVVIEYLAPNTNKPLHLGHVRNLAIGNSMAKILKFSGRSVKQVNLMNDRGIHICKSMLAYDKWGDHKKPDKKTDHFVGEYYVMFSKKVEKNEHLEEDALALLNEWEAGNKGVRKLWQQMNKWAYDGFNETLERFGVKFDKHYYESEYFDKAKDVVLKALKKGLVVKEEDGAVVAELGNIPKKVLLRADGTSIYITQDIYLAIMRQKEFKADKGLYVVASEQNLHFKQLFAILQKFGHKWAENLHHLSYGMVHLPSGRMKSREGTVVDADDLMDEVVDLARKEISSRHKLSKKDLDVRAEQIGIGALKFFMLQNDMVKDMTFNPAESVSFEGETGPYVQYAHARACSVLRKSPVKLITKVNYKWYRAPEEFALITLLSRFPSIVSECASSYKIHPIARYCLDVAQTFNNFYHACPILSEEDDLLKARLLLCECVRVVLEEALGLLGIDAPQEM